MPDLIAVPAGDAINKTHGLEAGKISCDFRIGKRVFIGALKNAPHFFLNYARQLGIPAKIKCLLAAHLRLQQSHIRKDPAKIKDVKINKKEKMVGPNNVATCPGFPY